MFVCMSEYRVLGLKCIAQCRFRQICVLVFRKWYPGEISRVRLNGTFDIKYDDGDRETSVARDLIRPVGGASKDDGDGRDGRREESLREGDKVEARHSGGRYGI